MSIARGVPGADGPAAGEKIILPRTHDLWTVLQRHWAGTVRLRWKALAMLHLWAHCNWSLEMIGLAFGHHRGHVCRIIRGAKHHLAEQFDLSPADGTPEDVSDET